MNRLFFWQLAGLGIVFWLLSYSAPTFARSLQEIQKSGELRVCFADAHASIVAVKTPGCRENCQFQGTAYETVQLFVEDLKLHPKYLFIQWDEQFHNENGETIREATYTPQLLESGVCDLYPSHVTKNEWRLKKLAFVTFFHNRMMVMITKKQKKLFKSKADLAGKIGAVIKGTSWHSWLETQNQSIFQDNPVQIQLMQKDQILVALEQGNIDFTLFDADNAIWSIRHQLKNAMVAFPVGPLEELGWAFRKQDQELQKAARNFLQSQKDNSSSPLNQLWKKTYGLALAPYTSLVKTTR